jgi:hypothetical protein
VGECFLPFFENRYEFLVLDKFETELKELFRQLIWVEISRDISSDHSENEIYKSGSPGIILLIGAICETEFFEPSEPKQKKKKMEKNFIENSKLEIWAGKLLSHPAERIKLCGVKILKTLWKGEAKVPINFLQKNLEILQLLFNNILYPLNLVTISIWVIFWIKFFFLDCQLCE